MPNSPDALCLSVSPFLKGFDRPLLKALTSQGAIAQWEYEQTPDEPSSLDVALVLLHDYLKQHDRPLHLIGHGISGLLALLYAREHPERVRSLTLLSVGIYPAMDWHAHYYAHRQLLPCSRQIILTQMVHDLFGFQSRSMTEALVRVLERDLDQSVSPHSLLQRVSLPPIQVSVPLLVCGSVDDVVVSPHHLRSWETMQLSDGLAPPPRLWVCSGGRYFFHYFYAEETAEQIQRFWQQHPLTGVPCRMGAAAASPDSLSSTMVLD